MVLTLKGLHHSLAYIICVLCVPISSSVGHVSPCEIEVEGFRVVQLFDFIQEVAVLGCRWLVLALAGGTKLGKAVAQERINKDLV
jgi:hypothetical protein